MKKMNQYVVEMDQQVVSGDILGAFEVFAADNCTTDGGKDFRTETKKEKLDLLRQFFGQVAEVNEVKLLSSRVDGVVTDSRFVFDFTLLHGRTLRTEEVIRRHWEGGLVVSEHYLPAETLEIATPAPAAPAKTTRKKSATPKSAKAAK